jgi:cyclic pyranopterin phosphate synthase
MPEHGIKLLQHKDILRFSEIVEFVQAVVDMGVNKVRITGGEPLVRKGIVELVEMISKISGITDLAMTTNGQLLEHFAKPLADAGLMRVNVSLDTLDPDKYAEITRGGDIKNVVKGLVAAEKAGLTPIKLNCVVDKTSDEPDAVGVKYFAEKRGYQVRFIHQMNLKTGAFSVVEGGEGGDCKHCNRLRLTADGKIFPCLFSDLAYDIRTLGIKKAIESALKNKPACGSVNYNHQFFNLGG